jgi:hypothetical protein
MYPLLRKEKEKQKVWAPLESKEKEQSQYCKIIVANLKAALEIIALF